MSQFLQFCCKKLKENYLSLRLCVRVQNTVEQKKKITRDWGK